MSSEGIFRLSKVMRIGDKIVIIRVEEEDIGTWQCKMFYLLGGTNVESVKTRYKTVFY